MPPRIQVGKLIIGCPAARAGAATAAGLDAYPTGALRGALIVIERLRAWLQRLREILVTRDPFDVDTEPQDSEPGTGWQELSTPGELKPRREQVK